MQFLSRANTTRGCFRPAFPRRGAPLTFCHRDSRDAREEQAATNQQFPTWPWCKSWELIPSTKRRGSSQISCRKGEKHRVSEDTGEYGARLPGRGPRALRRTQAQHQTPLPGVVVLLQHQHISAIIIQKIEHFHIIAALVTHLLL